MNRDEVILAAWGNTREPRPTTPPRRPSTVPQRLWAGGGESRTCPSAIIFQKKKAI